jgi:hypothetical protein
MKCRSGSTAIIQLARVAIAVVLRCDDACAAGARFRKSRTTIPDTVGIITGFGEPNYSARSFLWRERKRRRKLGPFFL